MSLAHQIGEDSCSIFSQDISQKSSNLLRLNLIHSSGYKNVKWEKKPDFEKLYKERQD